ncbi:MAG: hypothetical protein ACREPN_08695 [Rudaea sp.]
MRTEREIKKSTADVAKKLHNGIHAAEEKLDDSVDAFSARLIGLETQLRKVGERLLENARELGGSAGEQMRTHPLATFGVAFVAGITVARLLRR